ncbi:MAG: hypothetical protein KDE54_01005 [Caldilineaceae bacterium]|nr:hypothetical protein [Caldilineaceae bacterium]MCB0140730.1 hypothetical protein [Caldilineaceae bacterium]
MNVNAVYFYTDDQKWQEQGVAGQASRKVCPDKTTNYNLRVLKRDGDEEIRQIQVQVAASNNAPTVERFWVQPSPIVAVGQCVNIQWCLQGDIERAKITRNEVTIWNDAPFTGNMQDCPSGTGQFVYGVEVKGPGGSNRALVYIQVE